MKVIVRIKGGIGNQLFEYAAARRMAVKNNAELAVDNLSGFARDIAYRRTCQLHHFRIPARLATRAERLQPLERFRRALLKFKSWKVEFSAKKYLEQEGADFDERIIDYRVNDTVILDGYWQSERYFNDIQQIIREDLAIIPPSDKINQDVAKHIQQRKAVAVHVRFFDTPREGGSNNASNDYYNRAIDKMETLVPNAHYYIFSDLPAEARLRIPLPDERITLVAHNQGDALAYADLWLMTQCQHFIIANSTFSWWGAWLAHHQGKKIIAPGFEKRDGKMCWGFNGLLPEDWIKL